MNLRQPVLYLTLFLAAVVPAEAQISPGELAQAHSHLEGISNCTRCHILGERVSNEKCLSCHTEMKNRIDLNKGYHSSAEIKGKNCVTCHSDHHGKSFQLVRFDREKFNHILSGFPLEGAHAKKLCAACHKAEFISDQTIRSKKFTFLGLSHECTSCHADYHQNTLSSGCATCHGQDSFVPAINFSHKRANFKLTGRHQVVACIKCHKMTTRDGRKFQEFAGLTYKNCSSCHADPHKSRFGQDCAECHTTESFYAGKARTRFDHISTGFPLENKHTTVACNTCHKTGFTVPIRHEQCMDCHKDYHRGQFARQDSSPDCSHCHTTKGFDQSLYTIEQHNSGPFALQGAHRAVACTECHKKEDTWSFRNIGNRCSDCHQDIHETFIGQEYYPGASCQSCHTEDGWHMVNFDHSATKYPLTGSHARTDCRACHFRKDNADKVTQQFAGLTQACKDCHEDVHRKQFDRDGKTDCTRCHVAGFWNIDNFDHDNTRFRLEGKHRSVACSSCHRNSTIGQITYVVYKMEDVKCESCH